VHPMLDQPDTGRHMGTVGKFCWHCMATANLVWQDEDATFTLDDEEAHAQPSAPASAPIAEQV
jgi:hypothetical protein